MQIVVVAKCFTVIRAAEGNAESYRASKLTDCETSQKIKTNKSINNIVSNKIQFKYKQKHEVLNFQLRSAARAPPAGLVKNLFQPDES